MDKIKQPKTKPPEEAKPEEKSPTFPKQLRGILGSRHSCQHCEGQFELREVKPNGKKSRSWSLGLASWGLKEPLGCEIFVIKCPTCNQPSQLIIISKAEKLGAVGVSEKASGAELPGVSPEVKK